MELVYGRDEGVAQRAVDVGHVFLNFFFDGDDNEEEKKKKNKKKKKRECFVVVVEVETFFNLFSPSFSPQRASSFPRRKIPLDACKPSLLSCKSLQKKKRKLKKRSRIFLSLSYTRCSVLSLVVVVLSLSLSFPVSLSFSLYHHLQTKQNKHHNQSLYSGVSPSSAKTCRITTAVASHSSSLDASSSDPTTLQDP